MHLFACTYVSILFIKEHHIASQDVWPVACVYVCVCVLDFFTTSFSQLCVEGSWIYFVLLRFAEHRNEIEIGDFFSAFFFHSKKIVVLNLE